MEPAVYKKLVDAALRFDTNPSFAGNTALAHFFGIKLDEAFYEVKRTRRKIRSANK